MRRLVTRRRGFQRKFIAAIIDRFNSYTVKYVLTVGAIGGWADILNVSCKVTPVAGGLCNADGINFASGTQPVTIQSGAAPAGTYTVTITGTDQGVTQLGPPLR